VGGQRHTPSALPPERDPVSTVEEARHGPGFHYYYTSTTTTSITTTTTALLLLLIH